MTQLTAIQKGMKPDTDKGEDSAFSLQYNT